MKFNRFRYRDQRGVTVRKWTDYDPNGTKHETGPFSTLRGSGKYSEISDFKDVNPYKQQRAFVKMMRKRHIRVKFKRPLVLHDCSQWSQNFESSDDNLLLSLPGRVLDPVWGAVEIKGSIGSELFANMGPQYWRPLGFDSNLTSTRERLIIKALADAKQAKILTGEFIGDLEKTISMFKSPLGAAQQLLTRMLSKRADGLRKGLTPIAALSAAWLEYRFGWRPLFLDFVEIIKELDRKFVTLNTLPLVARASETLEFEGNRNCGNAPLDGRYSFTRNQSYKIEVKVRGGVAYQLHFNSIDEYNKRFYGLRSHDILTTAWELVPWSWLVDYLIQIGDFLEAGLPDPNITILGYWSSFKGKFIYSGYYNPVMSSFPEGIAAQWSGGEHFFKETYTDYTREINQPLSWIPQLDLNGLSSIQSVNAAAAAIGKIFKALPKIVR